jgi:serine/threonine protein phosphatase 1
MNSAAIGEERRQARLTFAVGDIHGCLRALQSVVRQCLDYAAGTPHRFVFIGDYIDRGPDSAGVIEFVRALEARDPDSVVCLMGNHEDLLLQALADGDPSSWLDNGGDATLRSFGLRDLRGFPMDVAQWLSGLRLSFDDGRRLFVHAGVDPSMPLDRQSREVLLWIRERFHRAGNDYGRLIVHGHTPTRNRQPDLRPNRINTDTGCVYGGVLTAAVFNSVAVRPAAFLTAAEY